MPIEDASPSVVVFRVGERRFAFPAEAVAEAIDRGQLAPVPLAPALVRGVMNHRGRIVTILDGWRTLRVPGRPDGGDPCEQLLLLAWSDAEVALEVTGIDGVLAYEPDRSREPRPGAAPHEARILEIEKVGAVTLVGLELLMRGVQEAVR